MILKLQSLYQAQQQLDACEQKSPDIDKIDEFSNVQKSVIIEVILNLARCLGRFTILPQTAGAPLYF